MKTIKPSRFERSPALAEVKVSYKCNLKEVVKITNSTDAFKLLYQLFDTDTIDLKEEFFLLLLNRANCALGWFKLSSGGTSYTAVDVKIIFILALLTNACNIILCHNHPSKNLKPSEMDISLTKKVKEAGKLLDITVLDHLIITSDGTYFDFADEGLL
jgi:DNA repair protein RadC